MTEDTLPATDAAVEAPATPEAAPAKVATPRAPKLTLSFDGKDHPLLKYAFPVKAAKFPITVNGAVVDAACTEGRGKAYTYLLINNTSFYVAGTLPVDAATTVNFPEGYKFDEAQAVRVSTYKPKAKKDAAAPADGAAEGQGVEGTTPEGRGEAVAAEVTAADDAPKAARRSKK